MPDFLFKFKNHPCKPHKHRGCRGLVTRLAFLPGSSGQGTHTLSIGMKSNCFFRWQDLGVIWWYEILPEQLTLANRIWQMAVQDQPIEQQLMFVDWIDQHLQAWIWSGHDPDSSWLVYALLRDLVRVDQLGVMPEIWDPESGHI